MSSIREQIQAVDDGSAELHEVPEWGVTVEIRSMTARSRAKFVANMASEDGTIGGVNDPDRIIGMWWHVVCRDDRMGSAVQVGERGSSAPEQGRVVPVAG